MTTKPLDDPQSDHEPERLVHADNRLANIIQWRCLNCGQYIFVVVGTEPPDTCEYCKDMTTWQYVHDP